MKIVVISDTHGLHKDIDIPDGDILIHAGDITRSGKREEIEDFNLWLGTLTHTHKIMIAGNHDYLFERDPPLARSLITNAIYLENESVRIEGLHIWGSPATPRFLKGAFNIKKGTKMQKIWDLIPDDVDILITHGPPKGILDRTWAGIHAGSSDLKLAVQVIEPPLHIFGHIHEGYGKFTLRNTLFVNASLLNASYKIANEAIVLEG